MSVGGTVLGNNLSALLWNGRSRTLTDILFSGAFSVLLDGSVSSFLEGPKYRCSTPPFSSTLLEQERYSTMSEIIFLCTLEVVITSRGDRDWYPYLLQLPVASQKISYYTKGGLTWVRKYPFYWKLLFKSKPRCMLFSESVVCVKIWLDKPVVGFILMLTDMQSYHWCYREEHKAHGCCHFQSY